MDETRRVIDPFGAPEFYCQDALFEMPAPGIVRITVISTEADGDAIVKVKLLMPLSAVAALVTSASAFTALQAVKTALLMSNGPLRLM